MKLSVIVVAYNVQDYINRCLESLHFQKFDDVEFLIIDDGSTDKTAECIKKFIKEKKDTRFKYYYKKNGGQADARNFGIKKASGDYIWYVDGDDYITYKSDICNNFINQMNKYKLDILIFNFKFGKEWPKKYADVVALKNKSDNKIKSGILMLDNKNFNFSVWHMIFKRDFINNNYLFFKKGSTAEDLLYTFQCLLKCQRAMYNPTIAYIYDYRENSITKTQDPKQVTKRINDVIEVSTQIDEEIKNLQLNENNLADLLVSGYIAQALTAFATGYVEISRKKMWKFFRGKNLNYKEKIKKVILLYMPNKVRKFLCSKILNI